MIVAFKLFLNGVKLSENLRHVLLHRGILACAHIFFDELLSSPAQRSLFGYLLWSADSGNHVFALGVDKVFSVEYVFTSSSVATEANARCRGVTHVAKHHRLHVNGCSPFGGNTLHLTIENSSLVHPAVEHGADSTPKLLHGVGGEVFSCLFFDRFLKQNNELLEFFNAHFVV